MGLESAIPGWLQKDRTLPSKTPPEYNPPFELYTARFPRDTKDLVLAVIGAQYSSKDKNDGNAVKTIFSFLSAPTPHGNRPAFHEVAALTDNGGYYNIAVLAYWTSKDAYETWATTSGFCHWWDELDPESQTHGWFLEVFFPSIERLETVYSTSEPEGVAHLRETVTGPIREHVYWGSMRDRLPISQTDELLGDPADERARKPATCDKGRVRVAGKKNLVVIRSGQDWSAAVPEEKQLYLDSMQPPLTRGMEYLRDHGDEVGCFSCRFLEIVDPVTAAGGKDRTFCLAYFDNLSSLESWSKEHRTHLAIFAEFAKYAKKLGDKMSLSLYHEVLVLEPEQQVFEYVGCHRGTGMLSSL